MAQAHARLLVRATLTIWGPEEEKDGLTLQEQGVSAVIDILATEIPKVQPHRLRLAFQALLQMPELNAMGAGLRRIERHFAQPPAKLGLAHAGIAQHEDLDLPILRLALLQIGTMGADLVDDILTRTLATDLD